MTEVLVTIVGASLCAASIDGHELRFEAGVAAARVAPGEHRFAWQVRGQVGLEFVVRLEAGRRGSSVLVRGVMPPLGVDSGEVQVTVLDDPARDATREPPHGAA